MLGNNSEPPTSEKGAAIAVYFYSMGNNTPVIYVFYWWSTEICYRGNLFTRRVAWAAQVFFRIANEEEAHVVAGFASFMEGRADDMDEDDHIH